MADDEQVELFPVVGDGLTQEERLDAAIARMDGVTEDIDTVEEPYSGQLAYGRSWSFDFENGKFNRYGAAPAETTAIDTLKVWCEKVLRTYAGAQVVYPDHIGIDVLDIIGDQYDESTLSALMETVREALMIHDRIMRVDDMAVERPSEDDDYVIVSMTIVTDSDAFELSTEVAP